MSYLRDHESPNEATITFLDRESPIYRTSDNVVRRLAAKAGIESMTNFSTPLGANSKVASNSYYGRLSDVDRLVLNTGDTALRFFLDRAVTQLDLERKKTIHSDHIQQVLTYINGSITLVSPVSKPCPLFPTAGKLANGKKRSSGELAERQVKFYQRQMNEKEECYMIPRNIFKETITHHLKDISNTAGYLISGGAVDLLQGIIELIMINNLSVANELLQIQERKMLNALVYRQAVFLVSKINNNLF